MPPVQFLTQEITLVISVSVPHHT